MRSFQIVNAGEGIQIHCDAKGLATLNNTLDNIRATGGHVHLRSAANGGHELAETTPFGGETIGEVIITWTDE